MQHVYWQLGRLTTLVEGQTSTLVRLDRNIEDTRRRVRALEQRKSTPPALETWLKLAGALALPLLTFWATGDKQVLVDGLRAILGK